MAVRSCPFNPYVELMFGEFKAWTFADEAPDYRGQWRERAFAAPASTPLDLEIGTGNGYHFAHYAHANPNRLVLGMELKFKTVVQSIRRCLRQGSNNSRMLRFDAGEPVKLFAANEIDNVMIHFPDPWPKKRHNKNRLINKMFLKQLSEVMKPGAMLEFKTDHFDYFQWAVQYFNKSSFTIRFYTEDLHRSTRQKVNFITQFEKIFLGKSQPIFYCLLENTK